MTALIDVAKELKTQHRFSFKRCGTFKLLAIDSALMVINNRLTRSWR